MGTNIAQHQRQARCNLTLHVQVPLLYVISVRMRFNRGRLQLSRADSQWWIHQQGLSIREKLSLQRIRTGRGIAKCACRRVDRRKYHEWRALNLLQHEITWAAEE